MSHYPNSEAMNSSPDVEVLHVQPDVQEIDSSMSNAIVPALPPQQSTNTIWALPDRLGNTLAINQYGDDVPSWQQTFFTTPTLVALKKQHKVEGNGKPVIFARYGLRPGALE